MNTNEEHHQNIVEHQRLVATLKSIESPIVMLTPEERFDRWQRSLARASKANDHIFISECLKEVMSNTNANDWMKWKPDAGNSEKNIAAAANYGLKSLMLINIYGNASDIRYAKECRSRADSAVTLDNFNKLFFWGYVLFGPLLSCQLGVWTFQALGQASWINGWPNIFLFIPVVNYIALLVYLFQSFWYPVGWATFLALVASALPVIYLIKITAYSVNLEWRRFAK